jgi:hypothetical protein
VPANATVMAMQSEPGAELACKAHNKVFEKNERGIISYYATNTVAQATTIASWLSMINDMIDQDFSRGIITDLERPSLKILGNPSTKLPGDAIGFAPKTR